MIMWVILILDQVFWSILMPPVALTAWTVMKLCTFLCVQAGLISETPCWLDTPFDLLAYWYLLAHGVHVRDEAPAGGIAVPSPILLPGIQSFRGAVLMNHRSFGDFVIDPMQANAAVVSRGAAAAAMLLAGALGVATRRVILIFRHPGPCNQPTSREELQRMCRSHQRYLLYPEGTRRASHPDADDPAVLRVGGLKNIWEVGDEAMIVITVGKEDIVNENRGHVSFNTQLYRAWHPPLRAADHASLESFLGAVDEAWRDTWRRAYQLRADDLERIWQRRQEAMEDRLKLSSPLS
mmetsp:Transcript_14753/g.48240  ORF Transcript_14753/g.48240 Transcript_14753/m.48240 type:complete len:294 (+) Transcript_14753:49-930(+)